MIIFDIETGPPDDHLYEQGEPFVPPKQLGQFDPASVKVGNLGADKAAAKIEQARTAHEQACQDYDLAVVQLEAEHWAGQRQAACKDARLGQVLAIGYLSLSRDKVILAHSSDLEDERQMLTDFWEMYKQARGKSRLVGHFIFGFDLPYLLRRSWLQGVPVPDSVLSDRCYFDDRTFIDTHKRWQAGTRDGGGKLGQLAVAMGLQGKPDASVEIDGEEVAVEGKNFWRLYAAGGQVQAIALEYLENDLRMTAEVALRLGIV